MEIVFFVLFSCTCCDHDGCVLKPVAFGPQFAVDVGTQPHLSAARSSVVILRKTKGVGYEKPILWEPYHTLI